jgi:hypothetical protein
MNPPDRHRLVLTEAQSEFLRTAGAKFAVIHPGSYPENPGRHVLDLIECDQKTAAAAVAVALGEARAVKPRKPNESTTRARETSRAASFGGA